MNIARRRLTRKLVTLFVAPVVASFLALGPITFGVWRSALLEDADRTLADHAAALRAALAPLGADPARLSGVIERIAQTETVEGVALYDEGGRPIARSLLIAADPARIDDLARRAAEGAPVHHAPGPLGEGTALLRVERVEGAPGVGAIALAHSLDPIDRMIRRAALRLAAAGGALAIVVAGLALWASRKLGEGLGGLVAAAERVAGGELDAEVADGPRFFEFPRVGRAFREMIAALADARARLERAEEGRRELERRVLHAQALAVVGQVSSAFAHEIGSPLSTILGQARLAAADEGLAPEARAAFDVIASQSERITRMVQRVLSVARLPREQREAVELAAVVREATSFLAPDLRARRVELRLDLAPGAPPVLAVRDLLLQVLLNLVANAADAQSGKGGVIRVSVAAATDDPEEPRVRLEVADAGPGVPAASRARIFEPFYSTKSASGGTGLGLAVVADIVRDLGGRVSVGDAPEGGALFTVTLPAHVI